MEVILKIVLMLILVNGLFFLLVAAATTGNPFKLGILICAGLTNCLAFFVTALATSASPGAAIMGFGARCLPVVLLLLGVAAIVVVQMIGPAKNGS